MFLQLVKLAKKLKKEKVQMDIIFLLPSQGEHGGARAHQRDAQRKVRKFFPVFYSQSLSSSCFSSVFINVLLREGSGSNILAVGPSARIVEVSQIYVDFTMFSALIVLKFPLI